MYQLLADQIHQYVLAYNLDDSIRQSFLKRLRQGNLTKDENPESHFGLYFLPFNSNNKKVFLVDHKRSGLWLAPSGHIDQGETLLDTFHREIAEELGIKKQFDALPELFLLTIAEFDKAGQSCKKHYHLWFMFETDGNDFQIDPEEFYHTGWFTISEALQLDRMKDPANIEALMILSTYV